MEEKRREPDEDGRKPHVHAAQDVHRGEIILRTPLRRAIFIAGLFGALVLSLIFLRLR